MMEYRLSPSSLPDKMDWVGGTRSVSPLSEQEQPTDLRVNKKAKVEEPTSTEEGHQRTTTTTTGRKPKPIPPPLDLSLQHQQNQAPPPPHHGSPKPNDKSLPLRKRWHSCSWSPVPMNGQDELVQTGLAGLPGSQNQYQAPQPQLPPYSSPGAFPRVWLDFTLPGLTPTSTPTPTNNPNSRHPHNHPVPAAHAHSSTNMNGDLQTPTPFYTPNEPSPKFMNSPVFSYSGPAESLYQGPFSPIRSSSLYPPPSSPFTNLSLNSPLLPNHTSSASSSSSSTSSSSSSISNSQIPSTLLSPAPSQASTNSLSYEDLSLQTPQTPLWAIFLPGTKVRFQSQLGDWYPVELLAAENKGDFAPNGLEVRKFIVTSSAKERIQVTFCPVSDPHHPTIEANCEPGHPFIVEKKGWCAVKPEVFQELYGVPCQPLECGDVCLPFGPSRVIVNGGSPANNGVQSQGYHQVNVIHHHQQHHQHHPQSQQPPISSSNTHSHLGTQIKMEVVDMDKVPVSVLPQHQLTNLNLTTLHQSTLNNGTTGGNSRKTFASSGANPPPAKKAKEGRPKKSSNTNSGSTENKGRRPMNGFLLFAKDKRPELIQMYPGKDNRSISVLLGEAWQTLDPKKREEYSHNAKLRADEQKKIHPDCWKRKRSQSINSSSAEVQ